MKDKFLTAHDIAEMLNVSYDKALEFIKCSGVEYVKIGRQYRVSESKFNDFLYPKKKPKITFKSRPIYQIVERR